MKILLATDGSDTAEAALDFVQAFPFPEDSDITLLTVVNKDSLPDEETQGLSEEQRTALRDTKEAMREAGDELLAREAGRLREAGWAGTKLVRYGHPADEIVRVAEELDTDLVVLGSHGLTGLQHYLLGSVSSAVFQHAPCSVLIVKGDHACCTADDPLKLLLAYDESPSAEKAVDYCANLPLGDHARVTVVSVLALVTLYRQDISQRLSWHWQQQKLAAREALERVTKEVRWATPNVDFKLLESGDVTKEILKVAGELGSDLIVVGHKGTGAIKQFLMGSVATRIGHHAPCSVLAIKS
jgi:nucleotide-binding universal stress UspA family protein